MDGATGDTSHRWARSADLVEAVAALPVPGAGVAAFLASRVPGVRRDQALQLIDSLIEVSRVEPDEVVARLAGSRVLLQTVWSAVDAASTASFDDKIQALAVTAGEALADPTKIDSAAFRVRTIEEIEPIHVTALMTVARLEGQIFTLDGGGVDILEVLTDSAAVSAAVLNDLDRLGLVHVGTVQGARGVLDPVVTDYGREILGLLKPHDNADGV